MSLGAASSASPKKPAHVQSFINAVLAYAQRGSASTHVPVSVILAQWGCESGWGRLPMAKDGHNLAGIMGRNGFRKYPSLDAFIDNWVHVMNLPYYDEVRAAGEGDANPVAVARALGESPWDAGHYMLDGVAGGYLVRVMDDFDLQAYDE